MKYSTSYIFATLLTAASLYAQGQNFYESYIPQHTSDTVAGTVSVTVYNNNFVRNNEYFGPYTEGITYIGSVLQPEASWVLSSRFSLSAGWYFRHYYGQNGFEQSLPVIRARYNFRPGAQLIIGQLDGQLQHGYIEPIYNTDNYFIKNPEYGVQLLLNKKKIHADIFMDWERFLLPGEAQQEEIVGGMLATYSMNDDADKRGLSFQFQSIIHHFGGQVDNSDSPLQSRANAAAGLTYIMVPGIKMLKKVSLSSYYIQALELSQTNTIPYKSGFGLQQTVTFENKWAKLSSGWFHGEYFFAPMGDYLFQSVSQFNEWYTGEKRDLITAKLLLEQQVLKGVHFGIRLETYSDIQRKSTDFSYGVNISVNETVFEKILLHPKE
jgi:hypothetical protein